MSILRLLLLALAALAASAATLPVISAARTPVNFGPSTTENLGVPNGFAGGAGTNESTARTDWSIAGTLSNLYIRVVTNDRGASTFRLRKNGVNGNQSVSIGASTTGEFEDITNTDTTTAGDYVNYQLAVGAGGTTFTVCGMRIFFAASSNSATRFSMNEAPSPMGASTTENAVLAGGDIVGGSAEGDVQVKARTASTLQYFGVNVAANSRSDATTFRTRKNGANGNISISVSASSTGIFTDTTNTDSIASGDLLNLQTVTGAGTGTIDSVGWAVSLITTTSKSEIVAGTHLGTGQAVNANLTRYLPLGVVAENGITTESAAQVKWGVGSNQLSNLRAYVRLNTVTATSTIKLRIGGADGNESLSIASSTTGHFEDSTNTDNVTSTSELNYQIVTGATGTSLTLMHIALTVNPAAAGTAIKDLISRGIIPFPR